PPAVSPSRSTSLRRRTAARRPRSRRGRRHASGSRGRTARTGSPSKARHRRPPGPSRARAGAGSAGPRPRRAGATDWWWRPAASSAPLRRCRRCRRLRPSACGGIRADSSSASALSDKKGVNCRHNNDLQVGSRSRVQPTDVKNPDYFHKVVDCQWACPAHTPVPEYIRLIAAGRYSDAYMVNWTSNVFPGILGRTCDRPCEPACRRGRVEDKPVAICRLKRVAADFKDDVKHRMPKPLAKNGKRIALVGGGPASLAVARDLAPLGYHCTVFDADPKAGGMMRSQIPKFRLPDTVIDEETDYILNLGVEFKGGHRIDSLKKRLNENYDAIFIGSGAPRGRELDIPGRKEAAANIHIGIDWLSSVSFGHVEKIGKRVIVLGGGNTAMDCCRSSRRLGGEDVKVIVRSGFEEMKASPWEKEDALHEGIPILNFHVPKAFIHEDGKLTGMLFEKVQAEYEKGQRRLVSTGEPDVHFACDDVLSAVGQENAFPWVGPHAGVQFADHGLPV